MADLGSKPKGSRPLNPAVWDPTFPAILPIGPLTYPLDPYLPIRLPTYPLHPPARLLDRRVVRKAAALPIILALNNLAASAECMRLREDAFRIYRTCRDLMRSEVTPSHSRVGLVLHNLSRICKEGIPLELRNSLAIGKGGSPLTPAGSVMIHDLWASRMGIRAAEVARLHALRRRPSSAAVGRPTSAKAHGGLGAGGRKSPKRPKSPKRR